MQTGALSYLKNKLFFFFFFFIEWINYSNCTYVAPCFMNYKNLSYAQPMA